MYAAFLLQHCWYAAVPRLVVRFAGIQAQKRLLRTLSFRGVEQISMRSAGHVSTNQKLTEHSCCGFVDVQHPPVARLGGIQEQERFLIAGKGPHELHIGLHGLRQSPVALQLPDSHFGQVGKHRAPGCVKAAGLSPRDASACNTNVRIKVACCCCLICIPAACQAVKPRLQTPAALRCVKAVGATCVCGL